MTEGLKCSHMTNWNANTFWEWADFERTRLNLSWSEIERNARLSNASVSKRFRNLLKPTLATARALAQAFGLREIDVLRRAGLASSDIEKQVPAVRELLSEFSNLSDEDQSKVLEYAKAIREMRHKHTRRKPTNT
jgi:transcriptional regulator with XRE-family HTH domain